jgi:hypothetical protein
MKRLRPQWQCGDEALDEDVAEAEQGLEDLADLFATELQQLAEEVPPTTTAVNTSSKRRRFRRELVPIDFGSQEVGTNQGNADGNLRVRYDTTTALQHKAYMP